MSLVNEMAPINTFVFLDLETTGLPREELNKTKITELSLVAVKRSHVLETQPGSSPRVQQKLTLCFNPRRLVQPASTVVTGLCNDLLEQETPFNEAVFETINSFLTLLSKPVCLIAHNGITYDYPILRRHLNDLKVKFSDDLLCADCLYCFYDLDTQFFKTSSNMDITIKKNIVKESALLHQERKDIQTHNESTPRRLDTTRICEMKGPRKRKLDTNLIEISKARRRLFFGENSKPQISYKLKDVYERYLNRKAIEAHRAENDCIMALQCSIVKAEEFVQWVDHNHCPFVDVKPMTIGVPLGY